MYYRLREYTDERTGGRVWSGDAHFAYPSHKRRGKLIYKREYYLEFIDGDLAYKSEAPKGHFVDPVE